MLTHAPGVKLAPYALGQLQAFVARHAPTLASGVRSHTRRIEPVEPGRMSDDDDVTPPWRTELETLVQRRQRQLEAQLVSALKQAADADEFAKRYEGGPMPADLVRRAAERAAEHLQRVQQVEAELKVYDRLFARQGERLRSWLGVLGFAISLGTLAWRIFGGP